MVLGSLLAEPKVSLAVSASALRSGTVARWGMLSALVLAPGCGDDHPSRSEPEHLEGVPAASAPALVGDRQPEAAAAMASASSVPAWLDPASWRPVGLDVTPVDGPGRGGGRVSRVQTKPDPSLRVLYGPSEPIAPGRYPVSVVAKAGDIELLQLAGNGDRGFFANFDLKEGVVTQKGRATTDASIEPLGDGWYKLTAVFRYAGEPDSLSIRRVLVIDDAQADWHPESSRVGHFFVATP